MYVSAFANLTSLKTHYSLQIYIKEVIKSEYCSSSIYSAVWGKHQIRNCQTIITLGSILSKLHKMCLVVRNDAQTDSVISPTLPCPKYWACHLSLKAKQLSIEFLYILSVYSTVYSYFVTSLIHTEGRHAERD